MEEKIKIYIPESINNILLKDMERFEFFKKDGSFNKNEFYNTLIMNYYEQYQNQQSDLFNHIKKTISDNVDSSESITNDIAGKILSFFDLKTNGLDEHRSEVTLSMKPTKRTSAVFDFIQNYCIENSTLSSYFRNMIASYTLLPQDRRERIIFKENFELLEKAIKDGRKVYFVTTNKDAPHIASPYSICNSKEELFNYLLADYNSFPFSFRIGRIRKITILNEPSEILPRNEEIFNKMEEQGPQYSYETKKASRQIKVYLTYRGKQMFKSIYLHRPKCSKVDGDFYYFDCSSQQAYQYFSRFGRNAIIVEPNDLTADMHKYFAMANKAYSKYVKNGSLPQDK